jgi:HEAT repeat protein
MQKSIDDSPLQSDGTYLDRRAESWMQDLKDADPIVRRAAAYALGEIGPPARCAVRDLRRLLKDEAPFVRMWAASALAKIDPEQNRSAIAALRRGLKDDAAFVRSLAASFLGALGTNCPGIEAARPDLEACLRDDDQNVRSEAALAIRRIEGRGVSTIIC